MEYSKPTTGAIDPRSIKPPKPVLAGGVSPLMRLHLPSAGAAAPISVEADAPDDSAPGGLKGAPGLVNPLKPNGKEGGKSEGHICPDENLVVDPSTEVAYWVRQEPGRNPCPIRVGGKQHAALVSQWLKAKGQVVNKRAVAAAVEEIEAQAVLDGVRKSVAARVDQLADGTTVIALHDKENTHVHINARGVHLVTKGSPSLIARGPSALPMVCPADQGDIGLLKKYVNLKAVDLSMWTAWLTYTMAHAKVQGNVFPILVISGGMGTAKSTMARITKMITDPDSVPVERMPPNTEGMALVTQFRHVAAMDNVRSLSREQSDGLCMLATRSSTSKRRLYSDGDMTIFQLHCAVVLNGIHDFVQEPDLAQRAMVLHLEPIPEGARRAEDEIYAELETVLPKIMRGLFDLISKILAHLPDAKVVHSHRLIGFVRWLAAWEVALGLQRSVYQDAFIELVNGSQLDALQNDPLAAAVLAFAESMDETHWRGTPAALLAELNCGVDIGQKRPFRGWPENPIALSKRLQSLQAALQSQGVNVQFNRGKHRNITITFEGSRSG